MGRLKSNLYKISDIKHIIEFAVNDDDKHYWMILGLYLYY